MAGGALRAWTIALLAAVLAPPWAPAEAQDCSDVRDLAAARRWIAGPDGATQERQTPLPDSLSVAERSERHRIRYRLDVSACAATTGAGLWLFRVGAPYSVTDDTGLPLQTIGNGTQSAGQLHNGRIPAAFALRPGTQAVDVELHTLPYIPTGVVRASAGPLAPLLALQARHVRTVVAFADAASGVVLVLGALALMLWWQRRQDRALLWLAVACGLWGLRGLAYFGAQVPVPPLLFEQFNPLNVLLASAAVCASVLSLLGAMRPASRRWLAGATAACVVALLLAALAGRGWALARALCLATGFAMISSLVVAVLRERAQLARWRTVTLLVALLGLLGCAVHDLLVVAGAFGPDEPSYVFWGFVVMLICFAAMSGQYVVATLNRAERSNEELERRVAGKSRELEASYAQLREVERDTARTQERERLLRDMHDGLGAQLMTALRGVERGALGPQQVQQSLQDSLDELRLLMDSTDMGHYLPGALAAWRNRWDHRLAAAGVELAWQIDESLDEVQLSADTALQVMRILQEAATNIVKHAQATRMVLDARAPVVEGGRELRITIRDDGRGLPDGQAHAGARGLKNMQHRAAQIGAALLIEDDAAGTGTCVTLRLALPDAQATSPRRAASIAASARDEIPSLR